MRITRKRVLAALGVASLTATAVIVSTSGSANAVPGEAPGLSAGVSALRELPPTTVMPPAVAGFVERAVQEHNQRKNDQADPETAKSSVRLLRSATGKLRRDVYAFQTKEGLTCFIRIKDVASCAPDVNAGTPGLLWTIGGGYGVVPSHLLAIASDDVKSVRLSVDGIDVPVTLRNNVVFGEFRTGAESAEIAIGYIDGGTNSVSVRLQG